MRRTTIRSGLLIHDHLLHRGFSSDICPWRVFFNDGHVIWVLPLAYFGVILGVRVYTDYAVPRTDKAAYFGASFVVLHLLASILLVRGWVHTGGADSVLVGAFICHMSLVPIVTKLVCVPERYRQTVNSITLTSDIVSAPVSVLL